MVGKTSFIKNKNALTKNGKYLAIAGGLNDMLQMIWTSIIGGKKVFFGGGINCEKLENFIFINQLIEDGNFKSIVDRSFPFDKIAEAHNYVESGSKRGNVSVLINR